ncbi:DMP19 family protein [Calycomorphotria hydatis]|uniref:DNA mimic protein DMP19 C-terminal domain-containing protein n=1 Tax=Calycomorphotria hydatis TaxID=2528027 RepID=A0A517T867_9PLAN|nr:DUF4375 domain-containing protein [Calycomorphotria hydatis]QDT64552.1 hypothetical protein V22_17870 [Calycomorphotria hydatis]
MKMEKADFDRLWSNLVDRKYKKTGEPLNESEQLLYALNCFAGGVPRSGMIGYFENSTGKEIHDAKAALTILGMEHHRKIIDDAQQILMQSRTLPFSDDQIELIPQNLSEEEYEAYSERLASMIAPVEERFKASEENLYDGIDRFIEIRGITAPIK